MASTNKSKARNARRQNKVKTPSNRDQRVGENEVVVDLGFIDNTLNFVAENDLFDVFINISLFVGFTCLLFSFIMPQSLFIAWTAIGGVFGGLVLLALRALCASIQGYRGKLRHPYFRSSSVFSPAAA